MNTANAPVIVCRAIRKTFRRDKNELVTALDGVSFEAQRGMLTALVGPDGAGKTTLIRLAAGLMTPDEGKLEVLGLDVAADSQQVQDRIGYMPQKFGLYEDLSVRENLDLYADLRGVSLEQRRERYPRLLKMTALGPFTNRLAGRLSGGMKQKLGLACTLVGSPELLLLDEPTVGVDPLSRRELWEIIQQLVNTQNLTVLLSTSYLDEAERCGHIVVLHLGKVLVEDQPGNVAQIAAGRTFRVDPPAGGKASSLQARLLDEPDVIDAVPDAGRVRLVTEEKLNAENGKMRIESSDKLARLVSEGQQVFSTHPSSLILHLSPSPPRFEDGFMILLREQSDTETTQSDKETGRKGEEEIATTHTETWKQRDQDAKTQTAARSPDLPFSLSPGLSPVVQVRDLVRQFGRFTAVDHVSFDVYRGEIFGLLGPNGAGKTTTFRMLCGLLPATRGTLSVAGVDLRSARASARQRVGYVAQKFSLYGQLSVTENLHFFASAYGLHAHKKARRIDWALREFHLTDLAHLPAERLPGGYKQRLAMAAALLHEPEILFLDEPTSGADPLARREFWRRITMLSEEGVTVIVTTHFMEEAEYCDRIAIMDTGQILAQGTPAEIRAYARAESGREPTMENAFIAVVGKARQAEPARVGGGAA